MKIVQIGTNTGNDDLSKLIQDNQPDLLLLVEPMKIHNEKIEDQYKWVKNKVIENIAITTDSSSEQETSFFYHKNDGPLYEVASIDPYHILKHGYHPEGIVEIRVECKTINALFEKYNLQQIDILFIDAEGLDDHIIKSIDFSKFKINEIYFENLHIKNQDIYQYLNKLGYSIIEKVGMNGWSSLAKKNNTR